MKNVLNFFLIKIPLTLLIFFILLALFLESCCADKEPEIPGRQCKPGPYSELYYNLDSVKPYLYFKPGTWWIYKNTKTNELDTIELLNSALTAQTAHGTNYSTINRIIHYESLSWTTWSRTNKIQYDFVDPGINPNLQPFKQYYRIYNYKNSNNATYGLIINFFYPFDLNVINGNGAHHVKIVSKDTTCIINSFIYHNTVVFDIDSDDIWYSKSNFPNTRYYWSKGYGLIIMENLTDKYSWILIDKNIIQ
jgi:hypothetical protein